MKVKYFASVSFPVKQVLVSSSLVHSLLSLLANNPLPSSNKVTKSLSLI
ncbi:MAG: hypothetical protein LBF15_07145 [Candidatus Peribacteria bacterium]|nr:hypothetical protein [Candidatus Peribacteria bacterium]